MDATLQAEKRETRGKNEARRLRANGRIPAVLYGSEKGKAVEISVDPKVLSRILHSESGVNTLIGLQLDGGDTRVLVKEYQLDPIGHKLLHADFYQVAMDKTLTLTVPIVLKGEARGVKQQGGIVDFVNREIEIEVLPGDIPEHIDIDISELLMNQGVRVRDIHTEGAKWKPVTDADLMIVHVVPPKAEEPAPRPKRRLRRRRPRRPSPKSSRRARRTRKKRSRPLKLDCWPRQSRSESTKGRGTTSASRCWTSSPDGTGSSGNQPRVGSRALTGRWRTADTVIAKPLTFMNLSGSAVVGLLQFYKIELVDLLVIVDDVNLELGRLRARSDVDRRAGITASSP